MPALRSGSPASASGGAERAEQELPLAPALTAFLVTAREAAGMNQEEAAADLHMSVRQYGDWERARQAIPRRRLDELAQALHLDEAGRRQLYRLTGHLVPVPEALSADARFLELNDRWARVHIHGQSAPACLADGAWNLVTANDAYHQLFEPVSGDYRNHPTSNLLRFILFHADAQHMLGEWRDAWMLPALCQFALTYQSNQTSPQHRAIRREIANRPELEGAYLHEVPELLAQPTEYHEEDGVVRRILAGTQGFTAVLMTTTIPLHARDHGYRAVTMSLDADSYPAEAERFDCLEARTHPHQ